MIYDEDLKAHEQNVLLVIDELIVRLIEEKQCPDYWIHLERACKGMETHLGITVDRLIWDQV